MLNACIFADVRHGLIQIRDSGIRVQCVVTSPPYWGLRDYKTTPTVWGGASGCRHEWCDHVVETEVGRGNWTQAVNGRGEVQGDAAEFREPIRATSTTGSCIHCGAWRGQLGLEPLHDCLGWARGETCSICYICHIREVFVRVRDVLRDDGVCFVNIGDTYAASRSYKVTDNKNPAVGPLRNMARASPAPGLKQKDLVLVPERLALALQADGWWVRSRIAWVKDNPMPESVTDRPSNAWEHIWLVSKSERYFWDAEAVKEGVSGTANARGNGVNPKASWNGSIFDTGKTGEMKHQRGGKVKVPGGWDTGKGGHGSFHREGRGDPEYRPRQNESFSAAVKDIVTSRNMRNVWRINTQPYTGKHYATFPEEVPLRAILAGTSAHGCCAGCGAPYRRIVEKGEPDLDHQRACGGDVDGGYAGRPVKEYAEAKAQDASATKARILAGMRERLTTGWDKTCKCDTAAVVPCVVLDPFMGSGTVAQVAQELGRNWIGIDLDEKNAPLQRDRVRKMGLAV